MKKICSVFFIFLSAQSFAQDKRKVEQYCEVTASSKLFSNRVTIDVDYGEERSFWKDNRLKYDDGKLKKINWVIDALNFLGKINWSLVNTYPIYNGSSSSLYHYIFKKEFTAKKVEQNQ